MPGSEHPAMHVDVLPLCMFAAGEIQELDPVVVAQGVCLCVVIPEMEGLGLHDVREMIEYESQTWSASGPDSWRTTRPSPAVSAWPPATSPVPVPNEIVTSEGPTGGPHVLGFTGAGGPTGTSFFAY
jgi:hypothetical protein